jgi:hypothetical protein
VRAVGVGLYIDGSVRQNDAQQVGAKKEEVFHKDSAFK